MFQPHTHIKPHRTIQILCLTVLALFIGLLTTAPARAVSGPQFGVEVSVPQQQMDTDGDGRLDSFSADFMVSHDGTATGNIFLDSDVKIMVQGGEMQWTANEESVLLTGTLYERMNGQWQERGYTQLDVSPVAEGGGADDIVFDILGSPLYSVRGEYVVRFDMPTIYTDTDWDDQVDPVSADVDILADGTARGRIVLDDDARIIVEHGDMQPTPDGGEQLNVSGTFYELTDGEWEEMGLATVQVEVGYVIICQPHGHDIICWVLVEAGDV